MVKRFDCTNGYGPAEMVEDAHGDWVLHEDYDALAGRLVEAEMLLRQCSDVWHGKGPLPAIIASFLDRTADSADAMLDLTPVGPGRTVDDALTARTAQEK